MGWVCVRALFTSLRGIFVPWAAVLCLSWLARVISGSWQGVRLRVPRLWLVAAGSLCSFCSSWPQLLGRAKGVLQCLSPLQALPGPSQLGSPDPINTLQSAVHSWIPAQPWHCAAFSINSTFKDDVQSQHSQPAIWPQPYTDVLSLS